MTLHNQKRSRGHKPVSFTFNKLYKEEALNENELKAYHDYESKNKAYYEQKQTDTI